MAASYHASPRASESGGPARSLNETAPVADPIDMTRSGSPTLALVAILSLACTEAASEAPPPPPSAVPNAGPHDVAVVEVGGLGEIHIELLPEIAPQTVAHFIERARGGHFDGTTFHRVIPSFMIQGGSPSTRDADPRNDGLRDEGPIVPDEFSDFPQVRGTVSLANRGTRDSGQMQFFIMLDERELGGRYAAFGRVVRGAEVADAVAALEIDTYGRYGPRDRPYPIDARIERVRIVPAGDAAARASEEAPGSLDPPPVNG
jgi:peptidyl-prolyl cis-trans isomerase B (cyclophilin B)